MRLITTWIRRRRRPHLRTSSTRSNILRYTLPAGQGMALLLLPSLLLAADPSPNPDPAYLRYLEWAGASAAHAGGLTGAGVRIGVVDSGVNRQHPALTGRVKAYLRYANNSHDYDTSIDDVNGHGTSVAQIAAGTAFGQWPGGIAPGAEILSARGMNDDGTSRITLAAAEQFTRLLIQHGMRIMNNSWGASWAHDPNFTNQVAAAGYRDFVQNHDGLVVFSAGNQADSHPNSIAALPSLPGPGGIKTAADLEQGWLVAAALDTHNRTALAEYSNACGQAMHYCLAAPGSVTVTGTNDTRYAPPTYESAMGTSFSAPIVSGAAALVWEAFPYFNNNLVRQTLLGTATDLGAPGVDPIFGHGALNIARAVKGPSRLDWGDLWVGFDHQVSVWGNDLSGDGALIKNGTGALVLEGRLRNRGGLSVNGGTVQAVQSIDGNAKVLTSGRLVLGNGIRGGNINGTLNNAGLVEIWGHGTHVNTTSIGGDYQHHATATLALELGQRFSVQGTATLEGGTFHVLGIKPGYTTRLLEEVLYAHKGVRGQFANFTVANSLFLEGQLNYSPSRVLLITNRLNVTAAAGHIPGISPMSLSSAARVEQAFTALDTAVTQGQSSNDAFWHAAGQFQQLSDPAIARAALDSLSGRAHTQAITLAFDTIALGRRAAAARVATWNAAERTRNWSQGLGGGGAGGMVGGGWSQDGWMIGQDHALNAHTMMGFAFGNSEAHAALSGERSRAHQTQAQLYLGRTGPQGYLSAQIGIGRSQRHIHRTPFAGDGWQGVYSQANGHYGHLALEGGREIRLGTATLTPYAGVEHGWLSNDGFQEWGSAGFGLRANAASMQRTQAIAGLRTQAHWGQFELTWHTEWQQVLAANGFNVMASFTGIESWSPLPMADAARSGGTSGIAAKVRLSPTSHLSTNLDQRFGPRGNERMAMLRYVRVF